MIPQFIGAFIFSSVALIGGSLVWPVVMKQERPPILQTVHDEVIKTDIGRNAEDILGVNTGPIDVPQTVGSVSANVVNQVGNAVQQKVESVVTDRIIEELVKRFDTLPPSNKEEVKAIICKPNQ